MEMTIEFIQNMCSFINLTCNLAMIGDTACWSDDIKLVEQDLIGGCKEDKHLEGGYSGLEFWVEKLPSKLAIVWFWSWG